MNADPVLNAERAHLATVDRCLTIMVRETLKMRDMGVDAAASQALARMRGIDELFALTLTSGFFESVGYVVTERARYPEKIRRDCTSCPRRFGCNEVCVARMLRADTLEYAA